MVEHDCWGDPAPEKNRRVITGEEKLDSVVQQYEEKNEGNDVDDYREAWPMYNLKYWMFDLYKIFPSEFFPSSIISTNILTRHFIIIIWKLLSVSWVKRDIIFLLSFFNNVLLICHSTKVPQRTCRFRPIWIRLECVDQEAEQRNHSNRKNYKYKKTNT